MKKALFLSFCILALIFLAQVTFLACACPGLNHNAAQAVTDEFNKSSFIFIGKVTDAKWLEVINKNLADKQIRAEVLTLKFAVSNFWKGKNQKEIVWQTSNIRYRVMNVGSGGSNCEYYFEPGKTYLVYATEIKGRLIADACGGTEEIEKAGDDLMQAEKAEKGAEEGIIFINGIALPIVAGLLEHQQWR